MKPTRERSPGGSLGVLLAANALPLGGAAAFLVLRSRGEAALRPLPEGAAGLLALVAGALVLLVLAAWGVGPVLAALLRGVAAARRRHRGLALVPLAAASAFLWLDAALLALTLLTLGVVEVVAIVRLGALLRGG